MAEALKERADVKAFLNADQTRTSNAPAKSSKPPERRIAVTLRLPERIAHALLDVSASRKKSREKEWSQQDIVAEALNNWLVQTGRLTD